MAKIELVLIFLVAAANLSMVLGDCDYETACTMPSYRGDDKDQACEAIFSYLDCLQDMVKDNPDCTGAKNSIVGLIEDTKDGIKKEFECDGAASLVSSLVVTLGLSGLVYFLTSSQ